MNRALSSGITLLMPGLAVGAAIGWAVTVGHDSLAKSLTTGSVLLWALLLGGLVVAGGWGLVWKAQRTLKAEPVKVADRVPFAVALILLSSQFSGMRPPLSPSVFCLIFLVLYWFSYRLLRAGEPIQTSLATWIFIGLSALVVISAIDRENLFFIVWRTLPKFIGPVLILDLINSRERARKAVLYLMAFLLMSAVVGISQIFIDLWFGKELTLATPENAHRGHLLRATGFALSGNTLGEHLLVSVMVSVYWLASPDREKPKGLLWTVFIITTAAAIVTYSRSVWLAGLVALLVLPAVLKPRLAPLWALTLGGMLGFAAAGGLVQEALLSGLEFGGQESTETLDDRYFMAKGGVEFTLVDPLRGVGIGNFADRAQVSSNNWSVHNAPLQVVSEIGIFGGLLLALLMVWLSVRLLYARFVVEDQAMRSILGGLLIALIALVVVSLGSPAGFSQFYYLFFALAESVVIVALREHGKVTQAQLVELGAV